MAEVENDDSIAATTTPAMPLPAGFDTVENIKKIEVSPDGSSKKQFVNIIGFVMDFQPPMRTRGTDFKCSFQIRDYSSRFEKFGLRISVFATEDKMPQIKSPRDAVLIRNAKVQMRMGEVQLLSHFATEYHILRSEHIPRAIFPIVKIPWISTPPARCRRPEPIETKYVIWSNQHLDELALPNSQEFTEKANKARNVRDKYSLLKDVKEGSFHDIIGEVRKIYGVGYDMVTVYFTDYTAHSQFYNYVMPGISNVTVEGRDGDDYGYIKSKPRDEEKEWKGPFGKMTIQLTLFDNHANFIREHVKAGEWLRLTNVQFVYGKNNLLEGRLRGDREAYGNKIQVEIMKPSGDPQNNDTRWVEGIQRKLDWTKKHVKDKEKFQEQLAGKGTKRKADGQPTGKNSRARRMESRANVSDKAAAAQPKIVKNLDLNDLVILHPLRPKAPVASLSKILQRKLLSSDPKYEGIYYAFENQNYKANVRVVDYYPPNIADFAVSRKVSEFDILPDYSGAEDDDPEGDMQSFREGKGFVQRKWEWRFALVVEDADANAKSDVERDRLTLIVGNYDAQTLLNFEGDACNLRTNPEVLENLKETLFKLWGDLEEQKSTLSVSKSQVKTPQKVTQLPQSSTSSTDPDLDSDPDSESSDEESNPKPTNKSLPPDSEEEAEKSSRQKDKKKKQKLQSHKSKKSVAKKHGNPSGTGEETQVLGDIKAKNKPFECCIKQYGVKVAEENPEKADAGMGKRWQRVFGLCGTLIK